MLGRIPSGVLDRALGHTRVALDPRADVAAVRAGRPKRDRV